MEAISLILIGVFIAALIESANSVASPTPPVPPETPAEVVVKIQNLLRDIEKKYSGAANIDKSVIARDALDLIQNDEKFKKQVIDTYKELGFSHFKMFVNHPAISIIVHDLKTLM